MFRPLLMPCGVQGEALNFQSVFKAPPSLKRNPILPVKLRTPARTASQLKSGSRLLGDVPLAAFRPACLLETEHAHRRGSPKSPSCRADGPHSREG